MSYDNRDAERAEEMRLRSEIASLTARIASEKVRQVNLRNEINIAVAGMVAAEAKTIATRPVVERKVRIVDDGLKVANDDVSDLMYLLNEVTSNYFRYKNLSLATKKLTELNDKYITKYKYYNKLRKITIGNIVGLDSEIVSNKKIVEVVEKIYLQTTDYWLSYANMAVTHWANDNEEASIRALNRSVVLNKSASILFFLIINLRFSRIDTAKKWYKAYLDQVDVENITNEFKYLLQLYLEGLFGIDKEFEKDVREHIKNLLEKVKYKHPDFGDNIKKRTLEYLSNAIHKTDKEYNYLRRYCKDYNEIEYLLSQAEKNEIFIKRIKNLFETEYVKDVNALEKIEEVLFNLISEYEKEEYEIFKETKYNEMIIKANGDLNLASKLYNFEFEKKEKKKSLDKVIVDYAFNDDIKGVDIVVKKFSLLIIKKWIIEVFNEFAEEYRNKLKEKYMIEIDGWKKECSEKDRLQAKTELMVYYEKHKVREIFRDKYAMIAMLVIVACIVSIIVSIFEYNKIILIITILTFLITVFILWRRIVHILEKYEEKKKKGYNILEKTLNELKDFRQTYIVEDNKNKDLVEVFANIEL